MQDFMKDRYGVDDLSTVLGAVGVVLTLVATIFSLQTISWVALAVLIVALARSFSKNRSARRKENDAFRQLMTKVPGIGQRFGDNRARTGSTRASASVAAFERSKRTAQKMWANRKTTMYFKCKNCGQLLSVPRGKGRIRVTCPKCGTKVEKKS